jgi:4-amino-4-deoxy-L-arabinose transferase-like glycosyltransferase
MIEELAAATAVALAAAATLRADVRAGAGRWSPDTYDYAIRMLMRRGLSRAEATERATEFFAPAWPGKEKHAPDAFRGEPMWWTLFTPRVVYPALAAVLFGRRGFAALNDVAAASYVASAVVLYRFLRRFGGRATAVALTLWYLRQPAVRDVAQRALSDSTAMLLWIASLDAMVEIADEGTGWVRYAVLTGALSFTRPLPYLPLAAGGVLALSGMVRGDGARVRAGAGIAALALGCAAAVAAVLARAGAPSTREHFERMRGLEDSGSYSVRLERFAAAVGLQDDPTHSLARWYAGRVALTVATSVKYATFAVVPLIALPGLARPYRNAVPLLIGALLGGLAGCVADPAPSSTQRTIVLPLFPVFAAGCVLALVRLRRSKRDPGQT